VQGLTENKLLNCHKAILNFCPASTIESISLFSVVPAFHGQIGAIKEWLQPEAIKSDKFVSYSEGSMIGLQIGLPANSVRNTVVALAILVCSQAHSATVVEASAHYKNVQSSSSTSISVSGSEPTRYGSPYAVTASSAAVDAVAKTIRLSSDMTVSAYPCGVGFCAVEGDPTFGKIEDQVLAYSASAGNDQLIINFNPIGISGVVTASGANGMVSAGVQIGGYAGATNLATNTLLGVDNYPGRALSISTTYPERIATQTAGMSISIQNGQSFDLTWMWSLQPFLYATGVTRNASGSNFADFSHTLTWGGVGSVYDATTHQWITDLNLNSTLGVNWSTASSAPVPEPATYAMLLAGLGLMCAVARRRKAKQA
jgi:hypothetical protein